MANTTTSTTVMEGPLTSRALSTDLPLPAAKDPSTSLASAPAAAQQQEEGLIRYIRTQAEHSQATQHAESTDTPTVLYVSYSPAPVCRAFTPEFEKLARTYACSPAPDVREREIVWCQMEYDKETSPMMKFGPQHCPILILLKGPKCRTILGGDIKALESVVMSDFLDSS